MTADPTALSVADPAVEIRGLEVSFALRGSARRRGGPKRLAAVDTVDLVLPRGQAVGLVGESGCGKTTLGRAIVGQLPPTAGSILVDGATMPAKRSRADQRRVQMVFQDPMSSLNPKMKLGSMLAELLTVHDMVPRQQIEERVYELLTSVGLPGRARDLYPETLSGGQRQRAGIARALALAPEILVADEITSALDVSIQAQVLTLLLDLKDRLGLTVLFISHNLAVIRQVCDQVAVMYLGRIVEQGPTETIFTQPEHPYTRLLLSSIPRLDVVNLGATTVDEIDRPVSTGIPVGCRFHPRCGLAATVCTTDDPMLFTGAPDHAAACHFAFGRGAENVDAAASHPRTIDEGTS